ncbi:MULTISPECIES: PIG-L deacetylase family protein [unclassified Proteiniphilum]|uniref:PIG-L deacetylase family protein n=1 Tax=unclassified Proteiniphilum TaxID=2622718 RepID=UPI0039C8F5E5
MNGKKVLAIFAHPDDVEMMCAGTLSLLKNAGWDNHMATMTPGDKGSAVHTREEIASIRRLEAKTAAETTGASYYCLGLEDLFVFLQ